VHLKQLKKHADQYELSKRRVKFLQFLTCFEASTSKYPETLLETLRKQNINRGLTNITDETYNFFAALIKTSLSHHTDMGVICIKIFLPL
jgi:hypothetical protein